MLNSPTYIHTRPRDNTPNKAKKSETIDRQRQDIYKGKQMATVIKVNLDQKQKSHASWLVTKIKNLIGSPIKDLRLPVFPFKWTQKEALYNRNILATIDGNLGETIEYKQGITL